MKIQLARPLLGVSYVLLKANPEEQARDLSFASEEPRLREEKQLA